MKDMVEHVLELVEATGNMLSHMLTTRFLKLGELDAVRFGDPHLNGALYIMYDQMPQDLMEPLRFVMGSVFDATLFWLIGQPIFAGHLSSLPWMEWLPRMLEDLARYREAQLGVSQIIDTVLPNDAALDSLLYQVDHFRDGVLMESS